LILDRQVYLDANLVYDPATDPGYKRWQAARPGDAAARRARILRSAFLRRRRRGERNVLPELDGPVYHLCRDPAQDDRMRPWFSHPKPKVDVCPNAGHWIMQDRKDDVNAAATAWIDAL
jgi:pimeloyl-ACP methyl ester carboxylesterase